MNQPKYLLVVANAEGELIGTPEVVEFDKFQQKQKDVSGQTDGNCGYTVLAEITDDYKVTSKTVSDCDCKTCSYYQHYLVWYDPTKNGERLEHEPYHVAEQNREVAQKAYISFLETADGERPIPEHLERQASYWEKRVRLNFCPIRHGHAGRLSVSRPAQNQE